MAGADPSDLERLQAPFRAALELPVPQREAFLRERCGDDRELFERVCRLLAAHEAEDPLLDRAALLTPQSDDVAGGFRPG